ncbi:MAG: DNA translocase FtsK 4TM domain-containing protein, partial [Pseudomonadota bacterium]
MALFWGEGASASGAAEDERRGRRGRQRERSAGRTKPGRAGAATAQAPRRAEHPAMTWLSAAAARMAGLGALALAVVLGAALISYDAADPSLLTATGRTPSNWLGAPGAMLADPLVQGLGLAAWGLVALFGVWGWRLALARGDERFWGRLVTMPPAIGAAAVFAALNAPWESWPVGAGLGGVLGDRGAAALLHSIPLPVAEAFPWLAGGSAAAMIILGALALGISLGEAKATASWMLRSLTGMGLEAARGAASGVSELRDRMTAEPEDPRPRSERLGPARPTGRARRVADAGTLNHSIEAARADRTRHDESSLDDGEATEAPQADNEGASGGLTSRLASIGSGIGAGIGSALARRRAEDGAADPASVEYQLVDPAPNPEDDATAPRPRGLRALLRPREPRQGTVENTPPVASPTYPGRGPEPVLASLGTAAPAAESGPKPQELASTIRALRDAPADDSAAWDGDWDDAPAADEEKTPAFFSRTGAPAPAEPEDDDAPMPLSELPDDAFDGFDDTGATPRDDRANPLASIARAASSRRQPKQQRSRRAEAEAQPSLFASAP